MMHSISITIHSSPSTTPNHVYVSWFTLKITIQVHVLWPPKPPIQFGMRPSCQALHPFTIGHIWLEELLAVPNPVLWWWPFDHVPPKQEQAGKHGCHVMMSWVWHLTKKIIIISDAMYYTYLDQHELHIMNYLVGYLLIRLLRQSCAAQVLKSAPLQPDWSPYLTPAFHSVKSSKQGLQREKWILAWLLRSGYQVMTIPVTYCTTYLHY